MTKAMSMTRADLLQTKALRIDEHHFFISDTHFGHAGMMKLCARPFDSVAEMDRHMIECWNAVVQPGDEVWHLGDFVYRGDADHAEKIFAKLNGRKHIPSSTRALDVGVDHVGFTPLNVNGVREWLARQQIRDFRGLSWAEEQEELANLTPAQGGF